MSGDTLNSSLQQLNWLLVKSTSQTVHEKDVKDKPQLSYSQLIREAIDHSPGKKCTLSSIYDYISNKYVYYADCPTTTWKNSIRHNLSLNKTFRKLDKANNGKGSFWTLSAYCKDQGRPYQKSIDKRPVKNGPIKRVEDPCRNTIATVIESECEDIASSSVSSRIDPFLSPYPVYDVNQHNQAINNIEDDPSYSLPPGMSLFDSHDLSSSFRNVYDQVFHNRRPIDQREEEARIDWLKIGLETAGIDYTSNEEMANVRADGFIEMLDTDPSSFSPSNAFPSYERFASQYRDENIRQSGTVSNGDDQSISRPPINNIEEDEEDDFDWDTLLNDQ